ncbi:anti-sigma factor [Sinorhizobium sp. BG8]|uniref:anti-sigma factor family protein n=1 Tax=Sinorhizobium sp. BG8 TaxID=2613773 RepID=UPI00193EA2FE|nr:anti-sigma factor [Sinorhizobium sp. BG8]QRM55887.1 anti-sigma factor [Sinorhizobium sp. BG8]
MSERPVSVTEEELHAYVDGWLSPEDRQRIDLWLAEHPAELERVTGWKLQNERIRAVFGSDETVRPGDRELFANALTRFRPSKLRWPLAAAAAIVIFAAGVVTGNVVPFPVGSARTAPPVEASLPREAQSAFLVYASEVRHPVEVVGSERSHLATWLGKRLDHALNIPDLTALGYDLVGGRLVPVHGKAGAFLMYQNALGKRMTVLIGRNGEERETSFLFSREGTLETFYWIDGGVGYAITGEVSREELRKIADECYRQFET